VFSQDSIVYESYFGKSPVKIDIKSVTKSITNLAIGVLVTQGKLDINRNVHEFYPEWKQEYKRDITIRHLLTHTSGLLDSDFSLVETAPDIIKLALASDLSHPVGEFYIYNNKAVNLLAGIIEKAAGRKLDVLMKEEVFTPLGITDYSWPRDDSGNTYVMAFLQMYPRDLLKIGQLVLNRGTWDGKRIISSTWFDKSLVPGAEFMPEYGLLWELLTKNFRFEVDDRQIEKMVLANVDPEIVDKARSMRGTYNGYGAYYGKLREVFGDRYHEILLRELVPYGLAVGRKEADGTEGYAGIGYLGQYLVIYPDHQLIAIRGINHYDGYDWETDEISNFPALVKNLVE
jgi:CubicO group peptidase (beta-lactamase class C family)